MASWWRTSGRRHLSSCPRCGESGRKVSKITVGSHTRPAHQKSQEGVGEWRFCGTPSCLVGYYGTDCKTVVPLDALRTTPFPKSDNLLQFVCFCFEHTVAAIIDDVKHHQSPTLQASITEACRQGLDACEQKNPEGRCCLGNVAAVVRRAEGAPSPETDLDCCKKSVSDSWKSLSIADDRTL